MLSDLKGCNDKIAAATPCITRVAAAQLPPMFPGVKVGSNDAQISVQMFLDLECRTFVRFHCSYQSLFLIMAVAVSISILEACLWPHPRSDQSLSNGLSLSIFAIR